MDIRAVVTGEVDCRTVETSHGERELAEVPVQRTDDAHARSGHRDRISRTGGRNTDDSNTANQSGSTVDGSPETDESPTTVTCWGKWIESAELLEPGMEVLVTDVEEEEYRGSIQYATTGDSYVVIEPTYLVNVTDVRNWVQCPRLYYLNKLSGVPLNYPVVKGTLVHEVFGDLLRGQDLESAIDERVTERGLEIGLLGESRDSVVDDVRTNAAAIEGWLEQGRLTEEDSWRSERLLISETFGIKGRADAIRRGAPVELKTGKNLRKDPRFKDKVQAACYALVLEEHGESIDTGTLLYTKNSVLDRNEESGDLTPAKDFSIGDGLLKYVCRLRNEIAAMEVSDSIPTGYEADAKCEYCFEQDTCMVVSGRLDQESKAGQIGESLPAEEREYFDRFYRAIEEERRAVHREYVKLWEQDATERVEDDRALVDLEVLEQRERESGRWELRVRQQTPATSKFRVGDVVLASEGHPVRSDAELARIERMDEISDPIDAESGDTQLSGDGSDDASRNGSPANGVATDGTGSDPSTPDGAVGQRTAQSETRVRTTSSDSRPQELVLTMDEPVEVTRIDVYPSELTTDRLLTALHDTVLKGDSRRKDVLFDREDPEFDDCPETFVDNNDAQNEAVRTAVGAHDFALIHGPPGTGKTYTIARAIRAMVERGERVLLSAFTNRAVDNALEALRDQGFDEFVRVGTERGVREDMASYRLERAGDPDGRVAELESAPVVAATTATCGSRVMAEQSFDVALVDEAAQLTEPGTCAAINLSERFVLVGDHEQLPPVVRAENELSRSLFERLIEDHPSASVMLDRQYRMNQRIQAFSSREFYDGALRPATPDVAGHTLADLDGVDVDALPAPLQDSVAFLDVEGEASQHTDSEEAARIADVIDAYEQAGVSRADIGIIAPFRAQVAEIENHVPEAVTVDTVDRFQGSSMEVIIVSFVATGDLDGPIFEDYRRINVALTRAKRALVLVGDSDALETDPVYRRMLEWAGH